ncbi:hypothetical protein ACFOGJ_23570 [Marinibaculum pumilum]|uniref:DUF3617 family protein n=1 Tax=Marinibaculum pumilum TaxID=1766165 RepID=A0ABV7L7A4_9PROT
MKRHAAAARRPALTLCAGLGAMLLALAAQQPAAAQSGTPCADINNTTDFSWPIRLQIGDGPPQQMRIAEQTFGRFCMRGIPSTDTLTVTVRSTWVPVGECTFAPGGLVTIERRPNSDGEQQTFVTCAAPRG